MKRISFVLLIALASFVLESAATAQGKRVDCSIVAKMIPPKNHRIVSFGVLNGRAETLPKPMYPAAGRAVGASGLVVVQIKIDPRGCVSEANAVSGHPLLLKASEDAARSSTFVPTTLSDTPVWVSGIITYNYIRDEFNWLELGFRSTNEDIGDHLPSAFAVFKEQLAIYDPERNGSRREWNAKIYDQIAAELAIAPKQQWLFSVGRKLGAVITYDYKGIDGRTRLLNEIVEMTRTAPDSVSEQLLIRLRKLPTAKELWTELTELKMRMYALGS
ncbi:MAG TPA: energy transducer TonB [Pyrinomonadaceae bacterium]|nr:energy transducer TonB [Pyrinomonadaceae bacterium]